MFIQWPFNDNSMKSLVQCFACWAYQQSNCHPNPEMLSHIKISFLSKQLSGIICSFQFAWGRGIPCISLNLFAHIQRQSRIGYFFNLPQMLLRINPNLRKSYTWSIEDQFSLSRNSMCESIIPISRTWKTLELVNNTLWPREKQICI